MTGLVNINTADVSQLMTLPGIGQTRAEAIAAYRQQHGNFRTIEEIMKVDGIKEGSFAKLKARITIQIVRNKIFWNFFGGTMAKRVLVVDDEKLIVKGIRFSLEQDRNGSHLCL